jgi:integrase/recombinase XerD
VLSLYRRHTPDCSYFGKPRNAKGSRSCKSHCPIWVQGTLRGEPIRRSLDLTSWEAASDLVLGWNASGTLGVVKPDVPTVKEAVEKFFADAVARQLSASTISKQKNVLEKRLLPWCESHGCRLLKNLDVDALRRFRETWPDAPITASRNLERLRNFFRFCQDARWIDANPAKAVKAPKVGPVSASVQVFTSEEIKKLLAACDRYPTQNSYGHDNPERVRAFVLVLRYSGLRIGDAVALKRSHLEDDKLLLRTQKTGTAVYMPLPVQVVDALSSVNSGGEYFFWTGRGLRKSAVADWQRSLRRVFALAKVDGNPHMFRHTFATDLLMGGKSGKHPVPIEDVAILLGHSSPAITQKYYSHFVKARRDRLEERVRVLWS